MFSVFFDVHSKSKQWDWKDEKSVVRWRTKMRHHEVQGRGRSEVLSDYPLRVGRITLDTRVPEGYKLEEQRLDETEVGEGTTVTLIDAKRPSGWQPTNNPADCAKWLGLSPPFNLRRTEMTKKPWKSKVADQIALSYGFGKTTLGKILIADSDKGVASILIDGSNAPVVTRRRRSTSAGSPYNQ